MAKYNTDIKYVICSHHPKQTRIGGCASIFNVFFSHDRVYDNVDYLNVAEPSAKEFLADLLEKTKGAATLLFNGCYSLCSRHSVLALQYARENDIDVAIYWHETSWHLCKAYHALNKIKGLIIGDHIHHWAASSQCKQILMFFLECSYEDVTIVYEAIPIPEDPVLRDSRENLSTIRFCGTGLDSDIRKGLDYFVAISAALDSIDRIPCRYDWFSMDDVQTMAKRFKKSECVRFPGFSNDFRTTLRSYHIFLLTSRDDPFPLAALEALANDMPVFCFDAVGTLEALPNEFVASSLEEMIDNIRKYWKNRNEYPPGFFFSIAAKYSTQAFLERISNHKCEDKSVRYFDMVVPRWRFSYTGRMPPQGKILLLATVPLKLVTKVIEEDLRSSLAAVFAREDYEFADLLTDGIPVIHYPKGAITPRLLDQDEVRRSVTDSGADIYLVLFYDEFGRGYEGVIDFIQTFGAEKVWIRTISGKYYRLSDLNT